MDLTFYETATGVECVSWLDENGSMISMTKEAYDALQAAKEASGTLS